MQQRNKLKEEELTSKKEQLEKQKKELKEKESSLQKTIEDAKAEAQDEAKKTLADKWKELEKAKDKASKQADGDRQQVEDLKEAVQRELESAQKAKADAAEKGYNDTVSTYTLAIRCMMLFCVILGLVEVIKHRYIFEVYAYWYTSLSANFGQLPAVGVAVAAATIFLMAYFVPLKDSDGLYFGLALRLIVLVTLFSLANAVPANAAAVIIYLSCIVVGWIRRQK